MMVAGDFDTSETESVLSYRVDTEADYGRLVCRSESQIMRKQMLLYSFIQFLSQGGERGGGRGRALCLHCDSLSQVSFR